MPTKIGEQEYYTADEVAQYVGVHWRTVHRWITQGKIKAVQLGGNTSPYKISQAELDRFLKERGVKNGKR